MASSLRTIIAAGATMAAIIATPAAALAAAPAAPGDALTAAVAALKGVGYNVSGTSGSTASGGNGMLTAAGSVDPTTKSATIDFQGVEGGKPVDLDFAQTGDAFYAKIDIGAIQSQLGVKPDQWIAVDESKLTNPQVKPFDLSGSSDALDIAGLLTSVSDVTYPDPTDTSRITGTVDLTAATGVAAPDPSNLRQAGSAAKTTPFTATIDDQGRLSDITIDADAYDGNLSEKIMFTDFGSPDPVTIPPASSVIPAPQSAYDFFNN